MTKQSKSAVSYNNPRFAIQTMSCQAWDSDSSEESLGIFNETEDDEMDYETESDFFDDEDEKEENDGVAECLKE